MNSNNHKIKSYNRKNSQQVLDALEELFEKDNIYTIKELIEEYMPSSLNNPFQYLMAEKKMRGYMDSLKRRFKNNEIDFGVIDGERHYGIMNTEGRSRHYIQRRYQLMKGILTNSQQASVHAVERGYFKEISSEKVKLPKIKKDE